MNEQLQLQLADLLKSLMGFASDATAWGKQEIPLLIQEKILLGRVEETLLRRTRSSLPVLCSHHRKAFL